MARRPPPPRLLPESFRTRPLTGTSFGNSTTVLLTVAFGSFFGNSTATSRTLAFGSFRTYPFTRSCKGRVANLLRRLDSVFEARQWTKADSLARTDIDLLSRSGIPGGASF